MLKNAPKTTRCCAQWYNGDNNLKCYQDDEVCRNASVLDMGMPFTEFKEWQKKGGVPDNNSHEKKRYCN